MQRMIWLLVVGCVEARSVVPAVSSVEVEKYVGRWYQISADRVVTSTFERSAECVTADYEANGTMIRLVNSERVDGRLSNITGVAFAANASAPGELTVAFDSVPANGSYWIVKLGPIESVYQYAVVSDDRSQTVFVLARNVTDYAERFSDEVDEFLSEAGFAGYLHEPNPTVQDNCTYPPDPFACASPARVHASCDLSVAFPSAPCRDVVSEMRARVDGQFATWSDPHNNGTYSILAAQGDASLALARVTGDGTYVDHIAFLFADQPSGHCVASACSASQVTSVLDFGTNFCNLHDLYCGSADGCAFLNHDLRYAETVLSCTDATTPCTSSSSSSSKRAAPRPRFKPTFEIVLP